MPKLILNPPAHAPFSAPITMEWGMVCGIDILVAATPRGVCFIGMTGHDISRADTERDLRARFPGAVCKAGSNALIKRTFRILKSLYPASARTAPTMPDDLADLPLDLYGTDFQLSVWKALLTLKRGQLMTYGDLAAKVGRPRAFRAAGSAAGKNPISILIPCHRVIGAGTSVTHYAWGAQRKLDLIGYEAKKI